MPTANTLNVLTVLHECDMRAIHRLRRVAQDYRHRGRPLRTGEALLFLNRRLTMARLVDSVGGVYTLWAPKDTEFDLQAVRGLVRAGLTLDVSDGRAAHSPERTVRNGKAVRLTKRAA